MQYFAFQRLLYFPVLEPAGPARDLPNMLYAPLDLETQAEVSAPPGQFLGDKWGLFFLFGEKGCTFSESVSPKNGPGESLEDHWGDRVA